jgi:hypothetical protein
MPDPIEDILQVDRDDGVNPPAGDGPGGDGAPKPSNDQKIAQLEKSNEELQKSNKDLQELVRQQSEDVTRFKDFYDSVTGVKDEKEKKKIALERQKAYDEDPVAVTRQIIREEMAEVKESVQKESRTNFVDRAMREVDKKFEVDWDKHFPVIVEQLKNFSKKAKEDDPVGTLTKACKLAGSDILKARTENLPPTTEGGGRRGNPPKGESEAEKIKNRILKSQTKSDNIFGLPPKKK